MARSVAASAEYMASVADAIAAVHGARDQFLVAGNGMRV